MDVSKAGLEYLKELEGIKLEAYKDDAGVWTIGVGHTKGVKKGDIITEEECDRFLLEDTKFVEACLDRSGLVLTQNQFDALFMLIFNIGAPRFMSSTVYKKISQGANRKDITNAWLMWNKLRNYKTLTLEISKGLENRRKKEIEYYFK